MNRKHKGWFVGILLSVIALVAFGSTFFIFRQKEKMRGQQEVPLTVVTSFYPLYIAALNVTDQVEGVSLRNLSEPETGCLHDYQLSPQDMRLLSEAQLFFVNGGGIETFLKDVAKQNPKLSIIDTGADISLQEDNAHVWMSVALHKIQVQRMVDAMAAADPAHEKDYRENGAAYQKKLDGLIDREQALRYATEGKSVVLFHEAFAYLAEDLGMEVVYVMDLDEERQVGAGEVAQMLDVISQKKVPVVFAEEAYGGDMGDVVKRQSTAVPLYLNTLVRGSYDKDSYLSQMEQNLTVLEAYGFSR